MSYDTDTPGSQPDAEESEPRGLRQALKPLRDNGRFRLLWMSNLFFFGGVWTQTLVMAWLAYETTGSALLVAVFGAVRLSPLLLGPFAGVFADRHNRVRLLLLAGSWAVLAVGVVAGLASLGFLPYWVLLLGGLAIGLAQSPSQPARASLVFDLVSRNNLSNANALNSMAINMTQVIGPALGGAMISAVGAPAALWISTCWYALSVVMLLPLRSHQQVLHAHTGSAVRMVTSGLRSIRSNQLASATLLITLAANIFLWPIYQSFMPVLAKEALGLDAAGLGWLLACSGMGGLIGSVVIAALGDFRFKGALFVLGTAVWGLLWSVFALSHNVAASFILMAAIGVMSAAFGVLQTTLVLMTTPPALHGRALGLQELAIGAIPLASLVLGFRRTGGYRCHHLRQCVVARRRRADHRYPGIPPGSLPRRGDGNLAAVGGDVIGGSLTAAAAADLDVCEDRGMLATFRKSASPAGILTEATSLRWLAEATTGGGAPVAQLVDSGDEWLETAMLEASTPSREDAREFGRRLAVTHAAGSGWFGAPPPGLPAGQAVLAELPSPATEAPRYASWGCFFAELRLQPYLEMARDDGKFDPDETRLLTDVVARVAAGDFDADQPRAVLEAHGRRGGTNPAAARNHGDLWGGNVVWASGPDGVAGTLIDPSAHGGHAETDLAELAVFGSPHLTDTIGGYQELSPLADGWQERVPVHQLHMLLVHVVLFGGGYVHQAVAVADRFG